MGESDPHHRCPRCQGLLEIHHSLPPEGGSALRARFDGRLSLRYDAPPPERSGVWRFREVVLPSAGDADIVTHPEGNTPLLTP